MIARDCPPDGKLEEKSRERAAWEQAAAAARLRGAAEALSVLQGRPPAEQQRASRFAVGLLGAHVSPADWVGAGLPAPTNPARRGEHLVPPNDRAVLQMARYAMQLYATELRVADRPAHWARLAQFFEQHLPASADELIRLRATAVTVRVEADDTSPEVISALLHAVDYHREADGEDAYLTRLARASLLVAYRQRGTETDLANSTKLAEEETAARMARYGPDHPVTLVARSLFTLSLLVQAESTDDRADRRTLAGRALAENTEVRVARDRLYGVRSPNAAVSRRYEARALILLGDLDKARACLEYTLAFEKARSKSRELQSHGQTHYHLSRVHCELGNREKALEHAEHARRIFSLHNPRGSALRKTAALIEELANGAR
jgi:hypothetical protein